MERFAIKIDKNLRANLYKICRLCGIDNPDKIKVRDDKNIVNLEDGEPELWKKVFDCIGLMITKDDKMPQFMCSLCVDKINDFFEFREMCYATDVQTRKLLGIKKEPKPKTPVVAPPADLKTEDIKEPMPDITPQQRGRKRRNADLEISRDIKTDESEDIKPATTSEAATSNALKKKRMKLSTTPEAETKIEPSTKPKKEPLSKLASKLERLPKIPLSKKRLKAEPVTKVTKKDIKAAKITKLMNKKLKLETPAAAVAPEEQLQMLTKKKKELVKLRKLPQAVIKAEKLKRAVLDAKIKEETPVVPENNVATAAPSAKTTKTIKSKLQCTICDEVLINKLHLDKHVKTTHIPSVSRYHCVQCNETLKKNMEIKNHNLWHKLSKTPFKCGNCAEACCSIYTYSKHIRDCNQIAYLDSHIPDWHCPDCSGVYETTYLFNIHPCVSKGLVCPGCDKPFKWKEDYLKHIPTCGAAFHQIPPYMTSNIQVKNEAELPTSPIPPHATQALPSAATSVLVQSIPSTRIQPPQLDSTQCVVIPGNISFNEEEPGAASPSKSSRKGKRITKKDLKRFDKLLKSTMTTLVSIKHEPNLGSDYDVTAADGIQSSSTTEIKERSELTSSSPMEPRSRSGSPMAFGGDDFHHNGDDSDSADEQAPTTKPVGKIKQEIIDEGYRDLYNNIEVNIKHEVEVNKNITSEPALKPILKLKITKEHGTLNSILVDSPVSEKKKKKKKRKEDRASRLSPEKEGHTAGVKQAPNLPTPPSPTSTELVKSSLAASVEKNLSTRQNLLPEFEKSNDLQGEHLPPSMPLPEIVTIKQEIIEHDVDVAGAAAAMDEETPSQNAPSIVAASSGSLQISCVSEGVTFHDNEETEEELPQHESSTSEEPTDWATPIPSLTLSLNPVSSSASSSLDLGQVPAEVDEEEEEVDVKPRLEDLIPMLQIVSVTSGAEAVVKPVKPPAKRKRRPKANQMPKIVSVSSGSEVVSYNSETDIPAMDHVDAEKPSEGDSEEIFDFSQVKIKEEVFDSGYEKENTATSLQDEDADDDEDDNEEAEEEESVEAEDQQLVSPASKKQAEENAYIANIDFNNLNIKQEKEYIDDGMSNSVAFGDEPADELGDEDSESESEDSTSDDEDDEGSESEREYRDLPSEDEEDNESDEQLKSTAKPTEEPTEDQAPLGLQILEARSEFCSPESSTKKTESEEINSDPNERKAAMSSGTVGLEEELQSATPMEVDGHNESNQKETEIEKQIAIDREQSVSLALVDSVEHTNSESGRSLQITAPDPEEKPSSSQITDGQMEGAETAPTPSQESVLDGVLSTNNCDALPPVDGVNAEILNERLDVTNSTIDRATIEGSVPLTQVLSHSKPRAEELSSARRLIEDCQMSHTDELSFSTLPTSADNADSSTSIQSSPHLPDDLNLNCSIDGQIHSNPTENHCENDSQITNNHVEPETTSMADHEPSPYHDRQYVNPNSEFQPEAAYNIPPSTIQQGSSPATTTFTTINDQPTFGEYPDLSLPTAGQLQTSFVHNPHTSQSNASLANLSSLSEEVQNLLNEETVSVNNFEYNDCVLRARGSIAPVINPEPVPVPLPNQVVFNDFENLNEIAENNNNANIERELQDELGNVLADVIADTSNDDHQIDENNVMNENRANFDIT